MRSAEEIIRRAASNFMRTSFIPGKFCTCDLFEAVNRLSQLSYEGRTGTGRPVLAAADDPNVNYVLRLAQSVPLTEPRWARKLLQMATAETALIAEYSTIVGLRRVSDVSAPPFSVEFLDHHQGTSGAASKFCSAAASARCACPKSRSARNGSSGSSTTCGSCWHRRAGHRPLSDSARSPRAASSRQLAWHRHGRRERGTTALGAVQPRNQHFVTDAQHKGLRGSGRNQRFALPGGVEIELDFPHSRGVAESLRESLQEGGWDFDDVAALPGRA